MKTLTNQALADISALAGGDVWVETLDADLAGMDVSGLSLPFRYRLDGQTWNPHILLANSDIDVYQPCQATWRTGTSGAGEQTMRFVHAPYQRDDLQDQSGAASSVTTSVKLADMNGDILAAAEALYGLVGVTVTLSFHRVKVAAGEIRPPDISYDFSVTSTSTDGFLTSFSLSTDAPLKWQWPPRRMYKCACRWTFKSPECGYTGAETTCAGTIADCRARNNISRIGCFPGCGNGGLAQ